MNNPLAVCVVERRRYVLRVCDCFIDWYLSETIQCLAKRLAFNGSKRANPEALASINTWP